MIFVKLTLYHKYHSINIILHIHAIHAAVVILWFSAHLYFYETFATHDWRLYVHDNNMLLRLDVVSSLHEQSHLLRSCMGGWPLLLTVYKALGESIYTNIFLHIFLVGRQQTNWCVSRKNGMKKSVIKAVKNPNSTLVRIVDKNMQLWLNLSP